MSLRREAMEALCHKTQQQLRAGLVKYLGVDPAEATIHYHTLRGNGLGGQSMEFSLDRLTFRADLDRNGQCFLTVFVPCSCGRPTTQEIRVYGLVQVGEALRQTNPCGWGCRIRRLLNGEPASPPLQENPSDLPIAWGGGDKE